MECNKCGDCCRFIALGSTIEQIRVDGGFPDRDFILVHWTSSEKPPQKLYPKMDDKRYDGFIWYKCDRFDVETNLCDDYENKGDICRNAECPKNGDR